MEKDELAERVRIAHAQATAAQAIMQALLMTLLDKGLGLEIIKEAFDRAADTNVAASYSDNKEFKAHAVRVLQVVDHMRQTIIRHD